MKCKTDSKHEVLTLVKIKHRAPETRLNPCLVYVSRLDQVHTELVDERIEARRSGSGGCEYCVEPGMALRCGVSKSDLLP